MSFSNSLTRLINIQYPIVQAPMAGVSTPSLAAAASNAGALGTIGPNPIENGKIL
ncbi:MAG: nitronate monooxygenase [Marinobacter sp.]|uniref:nitronate monooxygenase n=1 Tax=Marinobacter sp. TaxID=50741 RepID=UPI003F9BC3ED